MVLRTSISPIKIARSGQRSKAIEMNARTILGHAHELVAVVPQWSANFLSDPP